MPGTVLFWKTKLSKKLVMKWQLISINNHILLKESHTLLNKSIVKYKKKEEKEGGKEREGKKIWNVQSGYSAGIQKETNFN